MIHNLILHLSIKTLIDFQIKEGKTEKEIYDLFEK